MTYIAGLIVGIIFGYLLKRSRVCFTGTIRDIYLEKRSYNIVLILGLIATEGFIHFLLVYTGKIGAPFFSCFSIFSVILGSFLFGFGAVMTSGCMTMTLVKSGDGRIIGLISLLTFTVVGYFFSSGPMHTTTRKILEIWQTYDRSLIENPRNAMLFFMLLVIITYGIMIYHIMQKKKKNKREQSKSLYKILFQNKYKKEIVMILMGVVMGLTFKISENFGRIGGFAITSPILSIAYTFLKPKAIVGG